jgi:hypothetical protein
MTTTLRVSLSGGEAAFGRVRAADVGRLLVGVEQVLARAAAHVVAGQPGRGRGRRGRLIEEATRLRLLAIEPGSVVGVLQVPGAGEVEGGLDLDLAELASLGETALRYAVSTAVEGRWRYSDVAAAFVTLAEGVGVGSRCDAITITATDADDLQRVIIDPDRRERLRLVAEPAPLPRTDAVSGTLVEADFERRTARLRTPFGQAIAVHFDADLDDAVYETLRHQSELRGEVAYDPETLEVRSIRVRRLGRAEQLEMATDAARFWEAPRPFAALQTEQGAPVSVDLESLWIPDLTDEQRDQLVKAAETGES